MDRSGGLDRLEALRIEEILKDYKENSPEIPGLAGVTSEHITRLREFLILVARGMWGGTVYYNDAQNHIGVQRDVIGRILGVISDFERESGRPLLSALVVLKPEENKRMKGKIAMPSYGFFYMYFPEAETPKEKYMCWIKEIKKLQNYWNSQ